jgi:hypothetical protein
LILSAQLVTGGEFADQGNIHAADKTDLAGL